MVVSAPAQHPSPPGPRPINLNKDIPQVLKLLEICFGANIEHDGPRLFVSPGQPNHQPALLWRLSPAASKLALGFVWEENGRIVGNVTVLTTKQAERYLVVNVAVHPDHRRRGIAHHLMAAVQTMVQQRGGHQILLQVVKDNTAAVRLYESLAYTTLGSVTTWQTPVSRLRSLPPIVADEQIVPRIRELRRSEWRAAHALDTLALPPDLNWPEPLPFDAYRHNLLRRLGDFVNGRQIETWVTRSGDQLTGLGSILTEWGRTHAISLRVHPAWQGQLERPLLAKLVRRLQYLPRRNVRIDHPDEDLVTSALLREANFQPKRTLTHMRLDF